MDYLKSWICLAQKSLLLQLARRTLSSVQGILSKSIYINEPSCHQERRQDTCVARRPWRQASQFPSPPPTGSALLSATTGGLLLPKPPGLTSRGDFLVLVGEPFPFRVCSQAAPPPVGPHHVHPGGPSSLRLASPTVFYLLPNTAVVLLRQPFSCRA